MRPVRPPLAPAPAALAVAVLGTAVLGAAVFGAAAQSAGDADVHYRSNEIGIPFERIAPAQAGDHRFVLVDRPAVVQGDVTEDERLLLEEGRQVRRWVKRRGAGGGLVAEYDYAGGRLTAERSFDAEARLTAAADYEAGELVSRTVYTYEPRVVRVESTGADGSMRFRATYQLAATGQVRDFVSIAPGQDRLGARFVFGGGALVEEVVTAGATRLVSRYLAGERYQVEEWRGGVLHSVRDLEHSSDGLLVAETRTEPATDRSTVTRFDAAGRVLEALTTERGARVEMVRHRRDAAGRIVTTQRETDAGDERWDFEYAVDAQAAAAADDPDGRLRAARNRQNGALVSVTTYQVADGDPSARQVDYYRNGVPYRRLFFRGDERVREQVLRDGAVIRERVFDAGDGAEG